MTRSGKETPDMPEGQKYHIILEKVPVDKQPDAALFLSGCFSLPPASTRGIAASGPIALLSDISRDQGEAVMAELSGTLPEGVRLKLTEEKSAGKVSRLQWPRPPRVYGRDLADFEPRVREREATCPYCAHRVFITKDKSGNIQVSRTEEEDVSGETRRLERNAYDKDPLFSGIKPLAKEASTLSSIRALDAGDTGFWGESAASGFSRQQQPPAAQSTVLDKKAAASSFAAKKNGPREARGLAAFMKPGAFAVVIARTREPLAVKTVAEIMGVSEDEARDKCLSLGLCVVKDVALDEAQTLLARFANFGVRARIVKPM